MRITIVSPVPPTTLHGNSVTAIRWKRLLQSLGHRVRIALHYSPNCDLLVALHARKSHQAILDCRTQTPTVPIILALTGTDLYDELRTDPRAQESVEIADRLIVLQPSGARELQPQYREKTRVIYQSVEVPRFRRRPDPERFEVCVMGHLRAVKDPFRTAQAARLLRPDSRIQVLHLGSALSEEYREQARREERENARYRWIGEMPRREALRILKRSRLLVLTSLLEGGANVVSEALAIGIPVLSSRISGSLGMLGEDYPGYFEVGDTRGLCRLLDRAESDRAFYRTLKAHCRHKHWIARPHVERTAWRRLLSEFSLISK